jgi:hypothetical protein
VVRDLPHHAAIGHDLHSGTIPSRLNRQALCGVSAGPCRIQTAVPSPFTLYMACAPCTA